MVFVFELTGSPLRHNFFNSSTGITQTDSGDSFQLRARMIDSTLSLLLDLQSFFSGRPDLARTSKRSVPRGEQGRRTLTDRPGTNARSLLATEQLVAVLCVGSEVSETACDTRRHWSCSDLTDNRRCSAVRLVQAVCEPRRKDRGERPG